MEIKNNILKTIGKDKLVLISIAGIILILCSYADISNSSNNKKEKVNETVKTEITDKDYVKEMEDKLSGLIKNVSGVGECQVMLTLKTSNEKILQSDRSTKSKSENGDHNTVSESDISSNTLILKGEDEEYPYVIKEIMPEVEGVVVVAKGAGNEKVKADIIKIIQALFNVEAHKISIIEMK